VTSYCGGGNMHNFLKDQQRLKDLKFDDAVRMGAQLADALHFLHLATPQKEKIYHCDLKPQNVLMTERSHKADVVLADFGSSKVCVDGDLSPSDEGIAGTLLYMAPEVHDKEVKTQWAHADVYSLGIILWELFSAQATKQHKLPKPRAKPSSMPGVMTNVKNTEVQMVIGDCLQENPVNRASALEVAQHLNSLRKDPSDVENVKKICDFVRSRVQASQTLYKLGRKKRPMEDMRRISLLLQFLEEDVKRFWTAKQRKLIRKYLESGQFCLGIDSEEELKELEHPGMGPDTDHCIYLWRNNRTGFCYAGKTDRKRKVRDREHCKGSSFFDLEIQKEGRENWSIITICQYQTGQEMNRLEPLHIIVFNTSLDRGTKAMGYNTEVGGDWGASII